MNALHFRHPFPKLEAPGDLLWDRQNCLSFFSAIWLKTRTDTQTIIKTKGLRMKRYLIPMAAFLLGAALIAAIYFGLLTLAQGWEYASSQFSFNRWYIVPIWAAFGVQAALYSILRFRLFLRGQAGVLSPFAGMMGASGASSTAAMVACCLHHVADVLPILGVSAAATFLTRAQRPFMLVGLGMNILGILVMLVVLYRERQRYRSLQNIQPVLEPE